MTAATAILPDEDDEVIADRLLDLARGGQLPSVDLLTQAIEAARPLVSDRTQSSAARTRTLWSFAIAARDTASSDVFEAAWFDLAIEARLISRNGWWVGADVRSNVRSYGAEDIRHVILWAWRGQNLFK